MIVRRGDLSVCKFAKKHKMSDFFAGGGGCGDVFEIDDRVAKVINVIDEYYGVKVRITSTRRSVTYNASKANSSETSLHLQGKAIDFVFPTLDYPIVKDDNTVLNFTLHKAYQYEIKNKIGVYPLLVAVGAGEFIFGITYNHIGIQSKQEIIDKAKQNQLSGAEILARETDEKKRKLPPSKEYYEYYHQDSSILTVNEFLDNVNSPAKYFKGKISQFLDYKNIDGVSNLERIWEVYSEDQKIRFSEEYSNLAAQISNAPVGQRQDLVNKKRSVKPVYSSQEYDINVGTLLYIPKNKANIEVISVAGKDLFMKQQNLYSFLWDEFSALSNDPSFIKTEKLKLVSSSISVNYLHLSFTCWIYIRSIDKVVNITPFVKSMDTVADENGGTFMISLGDISDLSEVSKFGDTYFNYFQKVLDGRYNISWFHKYLRQNDIVFIRYERLQLEERDTENLDLFVEKQEIPGKIYDMIGLLDNNSEFYSSSSNLSSINISGRDLNKTIQEDGCYFFPFALINGGKEFFLNYNPSDTVFKRLFVGGEFMTLFTASLRSIRDTIGFIFNQLTNTGFLPKDNDLFDSYKNSLNRKTGVYEDRQSKTYAISKLNKEYLDTIEQNGIWKIIEVLIDNQLDDRRLNNGELSSPDGPIIDLIRKVCQNPFVEFYGDTFGDKFAFIARQPIIAKDQIIDYFNNNMVVELDLDDISDMNLNWDERYFTWYQINPLDGLFGSDQFVAGTRVPIVYFEEYAQVFGMHKMVVSDNYIYARVLEGDQGKTNVDIYRQSLANDLSFVIESNSVLPFTRRGTITIQGGDRRIKKNTWIYFKPTNEIFFVKSVSNHISLSGQTLARFTTLGVERGMIRDFVLDNTYVDFKGKRIKANYFDIINIKVIKDSLQINIVEDNGVKKMKMNNTGSNIQLVNKDLFDYFFSARQFSVKYEDASSNNTKIYE